jgi:addiction module HigA family antidote
MTLTLGTGELLRTEIERSGLTQSQFGKALGVSRQAVNNLINGRQSLSRDLAKQLDRFTEKSDYWLNLWKFNIARPQPDLMPMNCNHSPGEHLQFEIRRLGLSQREASEAIGVSRQSINNIIRGRQPISRKVARKLGELTGQPSDYWLRNEFPSIAALSASQAL